MESSSENSFTWTDTSSDSVDSHIIMAVDDAKRTNDSTNSKKNKKRKRNSDDEGEERSMDNIKEENNSVELKGNHKKRKIKVEPASDIDLPLDNKRKTTINTSENISQDPYDETFLELKVKEEILSSTSKSKKNKTKSGHVANDSITEYSVNNDIDGENDISKYEVDTENETHEKNRKKKKKKSKKKYDSDSKCSENEESSIKEHSIVKDQKFDKQDGENHTENSVIENDSFEEESEENGYEISAINGFNENNVHSLSFNKSMESTKINNESTFHENSKSRISDSYIDPRVPRISDRLQFEDEDITNIKSYKSDKILSKLKKYVDKNPHYKELNLNFDNTSSITNDDEIWILKCPNDININSFNGINLNIQGKGKIKVGGQTYDCNIEGDQIDTTTLLTMEQNKYKIRNFPLQGIIHMRKRIPKAHFRDDNVILNNQTNFIPLPETKLRHPLFGSNYKKSLKIPSAIAERLTLADNIESSLGTEKIKKKKHKKNKERNMLYEGDTDAKDNSTMKIEVIEESSHKKRKRKHVSDEEPSQKKSKKIKHDPASAEAWESEKAIEENLFNF